MASVLRIFTWCREPQDDDILDVEKGRKWELQMLTGKTTGATGPPGGMC